MTHLMNVVQPVGIHFVRGQGPWLFTADDDRYFDGWNDSGVASLGYGREVVGSSPLVRLPLSYGNRVRDDCAAYLCEATGMDQVMFLNSGAEAVETAIKLARLAWWKRGREDRYTIAHLPEQFHGCTLGALSVTDGPPYYHEGYGPRPDGFMMIDPQRLDDVEWDSIAAIILAPVLANSKVLGFYTVDFWEQLRRRREEHGFLIIFDEIQVGMGRMGYPLASQRYCPGVRPDIVCLGKGLALGLPAAACLARHEVCAFAPGKHYTTNGGSPTICAAIIELIRWQKFHGHSVAEREQEFRAWAERQAWIRNWAGGGVHWAFRPCGVSSPRYAAAARKRRLLLVAYRDDAMIRFCPPLNVTRDEFAWALARMETAYADVVETR